MSATYEKGALWRKWDLHIHTPASIVQDYGGDKTWPEFEKRIRNLPEDVKVIGINDYYFLDGYERVIHQKLSGDYENIEKIFPILEFRIDTFASATQSKFSKINLHILFDVDEDDISNQIELIKEQFIAQIHLSKLHKTVPLSRDNLIKQSTDNTLQTGFSQIVPSTDEVFEVLQNDTWKNRVILFLGYGEWNNLDKGDQLKLFKTDLYKKVDAFLTASLEDSMASKSEVLEQFGDKVFLHSLDIHSFGEFDNYKCSTWIKADPTFKGLKQALIESSNRIYLGNVPDRLRFQQDHKDRFIETVEFASSTSGKGWFDDIPPIHFNAGLVAIIGDKGNGKSALADAIGLAGNCLTQDYSFLCRSQFLSSSAHKKYSATVTFSNGNSHLAKLSDAARDATGVQRVDYLSQSFVNRLCNEMGGADQLQSQIDRVIFSHIPHAQRLGVDSVPDLIKVRSGAFDSKIQDKLQEIREINPDVIKLEALVNNEYGAGIKLLLAQHKQKLKDHDKNKPQKPKGGSSDDLNAKLLVKYGSKQSAIEQTVAVKQGEISIGTVAVHNLRQLKGNILDIEQKKEDLLSRLSEDPLLVQHGVDALGLISVTVNTILLDEVVTQEENLLEEKRDYIARANQLVGKIQILIDKKQEGKTEAEQQHNDYIVEEQKWQKARTKIIGSAEIPKSIEGYKHELRSIKDVYPDRLAQKYKKRRELVTRLLECMFGKEEAIKDIYSYVQIKAESYAEKLEIPKNEFIEFRQRVEISETFKDTFFSFINQNRTGTFYGTTEGSNQLDNISPVESEIEALLDLPGRIVRALNHNLESDPEGDEEKYATKLEDQLRKGKTKLELYNYLYCFDYLDPRFSITYNDKPITKLSPGEKGILLLAFYLLIDDSPLPIIIDQPEENIGNKTIYDRLVRFIKEAKQRRQIIIVTHNANLAIVCDADQILYSSMDKANQNSLSYISGSIEYDPIKGKSIDILEGTKEAFDNRRTKWEI